MQTVFYDILVKITKLLTSISSLTLLKKSGHTLSLKREDFAIIRIARSRNVCQPRRNLGCLVSLHGLQWSSSKALEEARNEKVIGEITRSSLAVYPNEVGENTSWAVDNNVAQLLVVSELTIAEGPTPEGAVTFEDVAFLRLNVQLVKFVTVAVVSIQQLQNATTTQPSVITVQALSKRTLRTQSQKDLKQNNRSENRGRGLPCVAWREKRRNLVLFP